MRARQASERPEPSAVPRSSAPSHPSRAAATRRRSSTVASRTRPPRRTRSPWEERREPHDARPPRSISYSARLAPIDVTSTQCPHLFLQRGACHERGERAALVDCEGIEPSARQISPRCLWILLEELSQAIALSLRVLYDFDCLVYTYSAERADASRSHSYGEFRARGEFEHDRLNSPCLCNDEA